MHTMTAEESLLLLCCRPHLAEGDVDYLAKLLPSVQDWTYVLWRAEQYRMLPLLHHHLAASAAADRVPLQFRAYMERWAALSRARSVEQFRELGRVVAALDDAGIDHCLLKGCGLAALHYPDPLLRPMQDLDVLVHPEDAIASQQVLLGIGYRHGVWDSDSSSFTETQIRLTDRKLHGKIELPPFTVFRTTPSPVPRAEVPDVWRRQHIKCAIDGRGTLTIPVFIDVHTNLSNGLDVEDVWQGASHRMVFGRPVRVQSATGMLWFIAARLYLEAFVYNTLKLSMFGDVHTLLTKAKDELDWAELLAVAYKYGMRPALFYVLSQIARLTGAQVPLDVLAILRPDPRQLPLENDWGDVMPKLLSRPMLGAVGYFAR